MHCDFILVVPFASLPSECTLPGIPHWIPSGKGCSFLANNIPVGLPLAYIMYCLSNERIGFRFKFHQQRMWRFGITSMHDKFWNCMNAVNSHQLIHLDRALERPFCSAWSTRKYYGVWIQDPDTLGTAFHTDRRNQFEHESIASLRKRSYTRSVQTTKTGDRLYQWVQRYIVVSCAGGYGMHTPTYSINNWSQGHWHDRSVGSDACMRYPRFGNGWGGVDFNFLRHERITNR